MRALIVKAFKANLIWGCIYSVGSALISMAFIRLIPRIDFAAYASALSASNIGVVMVEGGLTLGFSRYLPEAKRRGFSRNLYMLVMKRRVYAGLAGFLLFTGWSLTGLGHHALLDVHIGRWVWPCIGVMLFGELFSLLPFAGLQALFEYQHSMATRAFFVVVRGGLLLITWKLLDNLYVFFLVHASCAIIEGCFYHWWLLQKLADTGEAPADIRAKVIHYGYYSIAEKGAHAAGGINGVFLLLGYLLPPTALGQIGVAKELAQRFFSLAVLPINNLSNSILNWNTEARDIQVVASRTLALQSAFVFTSAAITVISLHWVLPMLGLVKDAGTVDLVITILSGIVAEYVLRYDQSYRFRLGHMKKAIAWAYGSMFAALALAFWMAHWGGLLALGGYFIGRLLVLTMALTAGMHSRYDEKQIYGVPVTIGAYALTVTGGFLIPTGFGHWFSVCWMLLAVGAFVQFSHGWLLREGRMRSGADVS